MQIPIVSGIYTNSQPDFRIAYPVNMAPVYLATGINDSYLKPAEGIIESGTASGSDRGGINWNNSDYRVMGSKLVEISSSNVVTVLGDVGGGGQVTMDYSFDRLAIASNGNLFYWDGSTLTQVTDPDLGTVVDFAWVDGYFMTTDGEFLVVTELSDPTQVNPLKYGSAEADPDPIVAVIKLRNEIYAVNRYTIEVFDNVGTAGFPFSRIEGAQIQKGCVGTHACCEHMDTIAFIGSGRNDRPAVYLGSNGNTVKISTPEIDSVLGDYTEQQLSEVLLESRKDKDANLLYLHLPDRTLVFDGGVSQQAGFSIWFILTSSESGFSQYRAKNFVWVYGNHYCGDPTTSKFGYLTDSVSSHWGSKVRWEFGTPIVYNEGNGAIFYQLELVALTGRVAEGTSPTISTSYSYDGINYSVEQPISAGTYGETQKRLAWRRQGKMRNWRLQRFKGDSDAHIVVSRLSAMIEPLVF